MSAEYLCNCVSWPYNIDLLYKIIDAPQITRRTILKYIDRSQLKELEKELGYNKDFHIINDWHVTYHKIRVKNNRYYVVRHSGIEHIFMERIK